MGVHVTVGKYTRLPSDVDGGKIFCWHHLCVLGPLKVEWRNLPALGLTASRSRPRRGIISISSRNVRNVSHSPRNMEIHTHYDVEPSVSSWNLYSATAISTEVTFPSSAGHPRFYSPFVPAERNGLGSRRRRSFPAISIFPAIGC